MTQQELKKYFKTANSILEDLNKIEVNPKNLMEAIWIIYADIENIKEVSVKNQRAKISNLPPAAIEKLIHISDKFINKLSEKMIKFQTEYKHQKINYNSFAMFENGKFNIMTIKTAEQPRTHTPGEWKVTHKEGETYTDVSVDYFNIGTFWGSGCEDKAKANATLAAAAPDLLKALEMIIKDLKENSGLDGSDIDYILTESGATRAIEKATNF